MNNEGRFVHTRETHGAFSHPLSRPPRKRPLRVLRMHKQRFPPFSSGVWQKSRLACLESPSPPVGWRRFPRSRKSRAQNASAQLAISAIFARDVAKTPTCVLVKQRRAIRQCLVSVPAAQRHHDVAWGHEVHNRGDVVHEERSRDKVEEGRSELARIAFLPAKALIASSAR